MVFKNNVVVVSLRAGFWQCSAHPVFAFLSILWITFFLAFIASMAFESPFLGLEKIIMSFFGFVGSLLKKNRKEKKQRDDVKYIVKYSTIAKDP